MTVPLRNLIHAARMIQKGDYSVRVKKVANDEIGGTDGYVESGLGDH